MGAERPKASVLARDGACTVLDAIDRHHQTEVTIVVFTSDHGDVMGDHGLMMKAYMPYCGTLQVPCVIASPGRSPQLSHALASSLDFAPTLLELAGLGGHVGMQCRSLVRVLDEATASVRDALLIEDDAPRLLARFTGYPEKTRTVVAADSARGQAVMVPA